MLINIHNVGHGQSALISCPNGQLIAIDAGAPLRNLSIAHLITTNLDEDHLNALPEIARNSKTKYLWWNFHINAPRLNNMKPAGMGTGVNLMYNTLNEILSLNMLAINCIGRKPLYYSFYEGDVKITFFANPYDWFQDTNNLSLVVFIQYGAFCIMFPGDLEKAGWKALLQYQEFLHELNKVTVLVVSHHGRENGYCEEMFEYCEPALAVISDKQKIYETQETYSQYFLRVSGCQTVDGQRRKLMSTRKDGHIYLEVNPHYLYNQMWFVTSDTIKRKMCFASMRA